jgi:outer membrane biosynthesis protein TonB
MHSPLFHHCRHPFPSFRQLYGVAALGLLLGFVEATQAGGQQAAQHGAGQKAPEVHTITEDELKQQFAGKTFFLRGGYFDNDLRFDERGQYAGNSSKASYTLSLIEIDKVHLGKRKVELEGIRYGLHFLGAAPTVDPMQASDKVRITPKKKYVKIAIDRAMVTAPKKKKSKSDAKNGMPPPAESASAVNPEVTTSVTKAQANELLEQALDRVFSKGMDERMIASLPDFWQLYYQAAAKKSRPGDPSILRQSDVDQKARLLTTFEPPSNDFAQNAGVAGIAQYRVVVAPDGKPAEIAVGRPIGFGLDENAVASIRKALFQPAMKDGKPVPVMVDLIVQFRIFSKKTGVSSGPESGAASLTEPEAAPLPGPYSAGQPVAKQQ